MSLIQFVKSRIQCGRMHEAALPRVNRLVRHVDAQGRLNLCLPSATRKEHDDRLRSGVLSARAVAFRDACALVNMYHRHLASPVGHLFSGGVFDGELMVAAVIVGRPLACAQQDGRTVQILRVATDGTRNACSKAMGWAMAQAQQRGYERMLTYTLAHEPGGSLRAVGFIEDGLTRGGTWSSPGRPRQDRHPTQPKRRWVKLIGKKASRT